MARAKSMGTNSASIQNPQTGYQEPEMAQGCLSGVRKVVGGGGHDGGGGSRDDMVCCEIWAGLGIELEASQALIIEESLWHR